jgi:hypothetical protein
MTFKEIEKQKVELARLLRNIFGKTKLFKISSYYKMLLESQDTNLIEAYSVDFIEDFLSELKSFTPLYQSPEKTESVLIQLNQLKSISTLSQYQKDFEEIIFEISSRFRELKSILNGISSNSINSPLTFPLIESSQDSIYQEFFGTLESVCIKIDKTKNQNKFVFVPSEKKIENQLLHQAQVSFELALNYFQKHKKKFSPFHEVLIYFENLSASYEGNSLGVALTIGFIEQLSVLYNLSFITNIKNNVATTGGVNENGEIISIPEDIIKKKVEVVFYSGIESFIIPKEEEETAIKRKKQLQELYPNRKLNLVAIENISELLNQRFSKYKEATKFNSSCKRCKKELACSSISYNSSRGRFLYCNQRF